jgi:hypothetical protein
MNGTITFETTRELAEFLRDFTGSTATFEVIKNGTDGWILRFLGGF